MNRAVARLGLRAEWSLHPVLLFFFFLFFFFPFFSVLGNMLIKLHWVHVSH